MNETSMLSSLLIRAIHGVKGSRPAVETNLGLAIFIARLLCGRLYEARETINSEENGRLLQQLWEKLPDIPSGNEYRREASEGKSRFNRALDGANTPMRLIRNKLAFHLDQATLDETFERMPDNIQLADFHTGRRGSTFFGVSDTVTAMAVGHLLDSETPLAGVRKMTDEAIAAVGDLQSFADGYLYAFTLVYLDPSRISTGEHVRLRNLPEAGKSSLGFYLAGRSGDASAVASGKRR